MHRSRSAADRAGTRGSSISSNPGASLRPVAISMHASLVDVSPSTVMQLKLSATARASIWSSTDAGILASVATNASIVAMSGRIMPAPLAMPLSVS